MKILLTIAAIAVAAAVGNVIKSAPYQCHVEQVAKHCDALISENIANLPGFVRLAFHDCVGENGCNGCLDLTNADNGGMKVYMDRLEAKYDEHKIRNIMSRADFWVLCSHVAIATGQKNSNQDGDKEGLKLKMKYGRKDCNDEDPNQISSKDAYPSPHGNYAATTGYFGTEFGLTANETIALIGAHTLGRARKADSGFSNPWVDGEFSFDNEFYKDILNKQLKWIQVDLDGDNSTDKIQWSQNVTSPPKNMMLNADMCLAVDVQPDDKGVEARSFDEIGPSPGADLVEIYATNNKKWLEDFSVAYTKMVEKTKGLQLIDAQPDGDSSPCKNTEATTKSSTTTILPSLSLISIISLINIFYSH